MDRSAAYICREMAKSELASGLGWGAHGGGAFSNKDPTKMNQSAAYICRQMAKSAVASGLNARCRGVIVGLVQLSYQASKAV